MKIITLALVISLASILSACSRDAKHAVEKAQVEQNPAKSLEIIRQAKKLYLDDCDSWGCDVPDELYSAEEKYFVKAAKAGHEPSSRELFFKRKDLEALKNELKSGVLARAKESKNVDLLVAAASIAGDDKLGVINRAQQIDYLKRAWSAGDAGSAGKLAHIFRRMKDFNSAYFWSLRCIQECRRDNGLESGDFANQTELPELEKHLAADQIAKLQIASALPAASN